MIQQFHFWVFSQNKNTNKKYTHPHVHCSIIYNSQDIIQWSKEWTLVICNNMNDLEDIMLSEDRERQILYDLFYMWNLKLNQ